MFVDARAKWSDTERNAVYTLGVEVDGAYDWLECIVPNAGIVKRPLGNVSLR